ncbi:MAG: GIY-YIG nuclease family protein [Burkholderiaceae bacterium]|nr:GIY-YIG nuclease family protein [Burkholderiaceae bacterium]
MGYVYLLSNPAMPGLVKIGCTDRSPDDRVAELSASTGVPEPFVVEYAAFFLDHQSVEQALHRDLSEHRVRDSREFFRIAVGDAKRKLVDRRLSLIAAELSELSPEDCWRLVCALPASHSQQPDAAQSPTTTLTIAPVPPSEVAPGRSMELSDCWRVLDSERLRRAKQASTAPPGGREQLAIVHWILSWPDHVLMQLVDAIFTRRDGVRARMGR